MRAERRYTEGRRGLNIRLNISSKCSPHTEKVTKYINYTIYKVLFLIAIPDTQLENICYLLAIFYQIFTNTTYIYIHTNISSVQNKAS